MSEPMWIGEFDPGGSAVIPKQGTQTGRCHALPSRGSFQRNEKRSTTGIGPFQPHVMIEQLNGFWRQREKPQLAPFAANAQLPFGKEYVVRIQSQDLG